jgi:DNA-binding response OmpR family regulator
MMVDAGTQGADVLLVEDDHTLRTTLELALQLRGCTVRSATTLARAREALAQRRPDLLLLDLGLPDGDGLELCRDMRRARDPLPILVLTARGTLEARVDGLRIGADDYLTKPFDMTELMARVEALIRRARWRPGHMAFTVGRLRVDPVARQATRDGEPVELTELELKLLVYLMERQGEAVSRADLLRDVWAMADTVQTRSVDVFMSRLRKLIEDDATEPRWLQSVRGVGYRLAP